MKWTEDLIHNREILRRGLDVLDGMVQRMENGQRIEIADATAILKLLNKLFDAAEEGALVAVLEGALRDRRGVDFVRDSRRLSLIVRNQFVMEDTVPIDSARQKLSK